MKRSIFVAIILSMFLVACDSGSSSTGQPSIPAGCPEGETMGMGGCQDPDGTSLEGKF